MRRALTFTLTHHNVYQFIVAFKRDHDGVSPSISEIQKDCGLSSTSVVRSYLQELERLGMIVCKYSQGKSLSRMIQVVGGSWIAPADRRADRAVSLSSAQE
jgi:SOS-response transcriptional repressor LexA